MPERTWLEEQYYAILAEMNYAPRRDLQQLEELANLYWALILQEREDQANSSNG